MAVLRTRRLAHGIVSVATEKPGITPLATFTSLFTVPSGYRAIVREYCLYTGAASTPTGVNRLEVRSSGVPDVRVEEYSIGTGIVVHVVSNRDLVMEPGDSLLMFATRSTHFYVSGALLSLPLP